MTMVMKGREQLAVLILGQVKGIITVGAWGRMFEAMRGCECDHFLGCRDPDFPALHMTRTGREDL
jgi:hypothetical protein